MNNNIPMPRDRTALLVLRVWIEHGSARPLRAYIRETSDVSVGFERTSTATDVEAAVNVVRNWLESIHEDDATMRDGVAGDPGPSPS